MDTLPLNLFEHLDKLRPFVEVGLPQSLSVTHLHLALQGIPLVRFIHTLMATLCMCLCVFQVVSDGVPLVQALVPKTPNRSFIIPGSDVLVSFTH